MKYLFTTLSLSMVCIFTISNSSFAQSDLDDEIKKIDGSVNKITITSNGNEYTFEGEDAEKLFKRMKSSKSQSFAWHSSDDASKKKKIVIVEKDGDKEVIELEGEDADVFIVKSDDDFEWETDGTQKNVKVEIENGEKKVSVTTKENGEETTEVYEGKEADEYIEKMKSENDDFDIEIKSDSNDKKVKKIIIETEKIDKEN